jgi:hypothetical protein
MADRPRHVVSSFCLLALALGAEAAVAVPRFTSTPVTSVNEDAGYTYNVTTADTQGGLRQVTATTLPSWLTLSNVILTSGSARVSGTPTQAHVGTHAVTLRVTNLSTTQNVTQSFSITVSNVNDAPVITGQTPNPIPLQEETALTIVFTHLTVTDPDNTYPTGFTLSVQNGANYTRSGNTITPSANFVGILNVPVQVKDGTTNSNAFNVRVNVANVNDAPTITGQTPNPIPLQEDTALAIALTHLTVTDADNAYPTGFTLSVQNGANYTRSGNTITPTSNFVGTLSVPVQVNDGTTNSNTFNVQIQVAAVNDAPVITGQTPNPIPLARNTPLTIQLSHLTVSDPDDVYPTGFSLAVLNGTNYTVSGTTITPVTNFVGTLSVAVRVNDNPANSNTFGLQVSVQIPNRPPEIVAPIPSQTVTENQPFQLRNAAGAPTTLAAFFRDPDAGDTLRYEVTGLPPSGNLVANATTGAITGTPGMQDARDTPYVVRVTANDSKSLPSELPTQSFNLTVLALARPDITLSITVTPAPAVVNTAVEWRFAIANGGQLPAGPVELTAEFAGNPLSFGQVPGCTLTPVTDRQRLVCTLASIGGGATATIVATGQAAQSGDATVTADVVLQGTAIDPNPANNHATATLNVAQALSSGPALVLPSTDSREAAAGDVNGDGFVDLALAKGAGSSAEVYLNVPEPANPTRRKLSDTPTPVVAAIPASDLGLLDVDRDADLDLVMVSNTGQGSTVFRNAGPGTFTLLTTIDSGPSNAVAAADFDGDSFIDLAFANSNSNTVYLNRAGTFTRSATLGNDNSRQVIAVDLDLDNLPDLVFANGNGPSRFYRNLGGGNFAAGVVVDAGGAESVASSDFNRDGRPDLVFGQLSAASGTPSNPIYQNNLGASGPLFVLIGRLGASPTVDVLATDVDGDGPTDVIVITSTGTHQVYRGNGAGGFSLHPVQFSSATATGAALGSFSADARVDLAVGGTTRNAVFFNDGRGALGPGDTAAPVIQLVGNATITLTISEPYQDAGASATDDIDGNVTSRIVTVNNVNTAIIGNYSVTYNVTDTSGNAATQVVRTVRVAPREASGGGGGGAIGLLEVALGLLVTGVLRRRRWGRAGRTHASRPSFQ